MSLKEFQKEVRRTMNPDIDRSEAIANYAMGLAGEAGEVIEPLKKYLFHGKDLDRSALRKEFFDVLWYVAALANTLDEDLDDAMDAGTKKLRERWPNGFKGAKS